MCVCVRRGRAQGACVCSVRACAAVLGAWGARREGLVVHACVLGVCEWGGGVHRGVGVCTLGARVCPCVHRVHECDRWCALHA